jgi:hypothetical protein
MSPPFSRRALLRRALVGGTALGMGQTSFAALNRWAGDPPSESKGGATERASHVEPLVQLLEEPGRSRRSGGPALAKEREDRWQNPA